MVILIRISYAFSPSILNYPYFTYSSSFLSIENARTCASLTYALTHQKKNASFYFFAITLGHSPY